MANRKKKRSSGCLVSLLIFLILALIVIVAGSYWLQNIKEKAARMVVEKIVEDQLGVLDGLDEEISAVLDNISNEDIHKITDIVDNYFDLGKLDEYIDMAKEGNVSEIVQYMEDTISDTDKAELEALYEKYKDLIP